MKEQGDCFPNHYVCDSIEDCEFGEDEDYCFRGSKLLAREGQENIFISSHVHNEVEL